MKQLESSLKNFWYAVEFSSKVTDSTLRCFNLFGEPWILFRNKETQVGCIQDECAHRACPLSLGTVIDGTVQCAYHGWQYEITGNCRHMPSCQQIKASVASLPCLEAGGLIWVWPGDETPKALPQPVEQILGGFKVHAELAMELPLEHGLLLENLLDKPPAPLTHLGLFAKGRLIPERVQSIVSLGQSLITHRDHYSIELSFEPPCYVVSQIGLPGEGYGKHIHQLHCCLPTDNMRTRLLYRLSLNFLDWTQFIPCRNWFWRRSMARWSNETTNHAPL